MDVNRIRELLPHRYPFQLVDKVIEMGANYIVGVKNVTGNEPFFQGHFPQEPVMPGGVAGRGYGSDGRTAGTQLRGRARTLLHTYFLKIDGVKFRQKVVPGDTPHLPGRVDGSHTSWHIDNERLCVCRRKGGMRSRIHGTNS